MSSLDRSTAPRGLRRRRRWLRRLGFWSLGILAGLLVTHAMWLPIALELAVPPLARSLADLRVSLGVERASLRRLEVRRLEVRPAAGPAALELLILEEGRVDFAPGALLRLDWIGALSRVRLRGLALQVDLAASPASDPERAPREAPSFTLPDDLPPIELSDAALRVRLADGGLLEAPSLALSLRPDGEGRLAGRGLRWERAEESGSVERAELRFAWRQPRLVLRSLMVEQREWLGPSWIDLRRAGEGELEARLEILALGGPALVDLELSPDLLTGRLRALDLLPERLPAFLVPAGVGPLEGSLDVEAEVRLPLAALGEGSGRIALAGRGLVGAGTRLDELEADLELHEGLLRAHSVRVTSGPNRLAARDVRVPLDAPDLPAAFRAAQGRIELELIDPDELSGLLALDLPAELRPRIELEADLAGGVLELRRALWEAPGASLRMSTGRIDFDDLAHPAIDLDLTLSIADLGRTLGEWPTLGAAGRVWGALLLRGRWPELSGELAIEGTDLVLTEVFLGDFDLLADLRRGRLGLERLLAHSPAARIEAQGSLELPTEGPFDPQALRLGPSHLDLAAQDLAALHPALPAGRATGRVAALGSLAEPLLDFELELELEGEGAETGPARILRSLSLAGHGDGRRIELDALRAEGDFGLLAARGAAELEEDFRPRTIELTALELSQGSEDLVLVAPTRVELGAQGIAIDDLELSGSLGRLSATGRLEEGEGRLVVGAGHLTLGSILAPFLGPALGLDLAPGLLDGSLTIELAGGELGLAGEGLVSGAQLQGGPPLDLDWKVSLGGGRGELRALLAWPDGALRTEASMPLRLFSDAPLGPGDVEVLVELGGGLDGLAFLLGAAGLAIDGVLDGRLEVSGPWEAVAARLRLEGDLMEVRGAGLDLLTEPARLDLDLAMGKEAHASVLSLRAPERFELEARGELGPALDLRALLEGDRESLGRRPIEGRLEARIDDIGELVRALEAQGLQRQLLRSGALQIEASVGGTLAERTYEGRTHLEEALVRLGPSLPPLRNVEGTLRMVPGAIELEGLRGETGGAPFEVQGRAFQAEPGAPYELDLTLVGEDLLLYRERGIQVRADANLVVQGFEKEGLAIGGRLTLSDGRFARNMQLLSFERDRRPAGARGFELFSFREPPLSDLRFDVEVKSRAPFRIDNNALRGGVRPDLRLRGTGEVPVLLGTIFVDPTRVNLPSGWMRIESGVVRFEAADPFVPQLALSGGMRLRGFDIQITIQGPYDSPEIVLSSSPPLSDRALLVLVVTGELPPEEAGTLGAASAGRSLAIFLARDAVMRWFDDESVDDDESLIERLDIVIGRDVTRTGSETVEARFRLADRIFRPNDSLFLHGERDVYDEFNYGLRLLFKIH